ncbi:hypothetical protein F4810DRAFT_535108 [Camillea tinctor]|nr:hypothetical protein F4810DRAFT_535108 [Camillea tinctor]
MTVTELAFLPSATPGEVPAAYLREGTAAIEAQDQWCAENFPVTDTTTSTPTDPEGGKPHWHRERRGAALYQQRSDGGVVLVTAHWASVEQHQAWIASPANQGVMARLAPLVSAQDVAFFHVRDAEMFTPHTLGAPVLSVTRVRVRAEAGEFMGRFESERGKALDELTAPYRHTAGWRVERVEGAAEGEEELVVVGGWESEESAGRWEEGGGRAFAERFGGLMREVLGVDVKTYRRIL